MTIIEYSKRARALSWGQLGGKAWWRILRAGRRLCLQRRLYSMGLYTNRRVIRPTLAGPQTPQDLWRQFQERSSPRFFIDQAERLRIVAQARSLDPVAVAALIAESERILDNKIHVDGVDEEMGSEGQVSWFGGPDSLKDKLLGRHDFIPKLIQAYWYTDDRRFAERAVSLWRDWLRHPGRLRADESIDCTFRLLNWLWMVYALRIDNFLNATDFMHLLSEVHHAGSRIETEMSFAGNHRVIEALGLWCSGLFFPELKRAWRWRSKGERILLAEMERQVFPDGVHKEMSSGYHIFVATHFLKFYLLSRVNGFPVPEPFRDRLGAMLAVAEALRKPNGEMPMLGDSDALGTRELEHLESALLEPALPFLDGGEVALRSHSCHSDLVPWYFGLLVKEPSRTTAGEVESGPAGGVLSSRVFPDAGYVLMRSGRGAQGHYLLMDAGRFGMDSLSHHGHADALHVEICPSGKNLVIDPGGCHYVNDDWRRFFRSSRAHSTVEVDGQSQSEIFGIFGVGRTARCQITNWYSNERLDFVEAFHDGYRMLLSPVMHRRAVLFLKEPPVYWIIVDSLEGRGEHTLDLLFHCVPEARYRRDETGAVVILETGGTPTEVRSLMCPPDVPRIISGQLEPEVQGWVARTRRSRQEAPVLSFKKRVSLPHMFVTLMRPISPAESRDRLFVVHQLRSAREGDDGAPAWELCWPHLMDRVCVARGAGNTLGSARLSCSVERCASGHPSWREAMGNHETVEPILNRS